MNRQQFDKMMEQYMDMAKYENIQVYPCLNDDTTKTSFEPHYFYQGIWAGEKIYQSLIKKHVDVGSEIRWVGSLTVYVNEVTFVDIRPFGTNLNNLKMLKGNILNLPFENESLQSISSLSVIEHIGLGRYGDAIDPEGTKKACKELQRVTMKNGNIYVSCPIGKEKTCFNAHRIHNPEIIMEYFDECELVEFSVVNDNETFIKNVNMKNYMNNNYACGMFWLKKKKQGDSDD